MTIDNHDLQCISPAFLVFFTVRCGFPCISLSLSRQFAAIGPQCGTRYTKPCIPFKFRLEFCQTAKTEANTASQRILVGGAQKAWEMAACCRTHGQPMCQNIQQRTTGNWKLFRCRVEHKLLHCRPQMWPAFSLV